MKKRIVLATLALVSLFAAALALQPSTALAASSPKDEICAGIGEANDGSCGNGGDLTNVIRNIINIFSIIVGIVAVIMVMVSGFKYVTSGGDSGNVTSAKNTLIYAIVGIVVVAFSQFIVQFVLTKVT